jgi:hypothetical protein
VALFRIRIDCPEGTEGGRHYSRGALLKHQIRRYRHEKRMFLLSSGTYLSRPTLTV